MSDPIYMRAARVEDSDTSYIVAPVRESYDLKFEELKTTLALDLDRTVIDVAGGRCEPPRVLAAIAFYGGLEKFWDRVKEQLKYVQQRGPDMVFRGKLEFMLQAETTTAEAAEKELAEAAKSMASVAVASRIEQRLAVAQNNLAIINRYLKEMKEIT